MPRISSKYVDSGFIYSLVTRRAYKIWQDRIQANQDGSPDEDWYKAEAEFQKFMEVAEKGVLRGENASVPYNQATFLNCTYGDFRRAGVGDCADYVFGKLPTSESIFR